MSSSKQIYVAIIDDDENVGRALGRLLRSADIQAVNYSSAEAYLADSKHPQFDCLLLDLQLGGMSGVELSQQLSANGRTTPIILMTAREEIEARAEAEAAGCVAYFRKNDSGADVIETIRRIAA